MTSKNNRAPLLCCFKLYASFYRHQWIQTKVTVRKRSIRVKIGDFFFPVWPWNLTDDLEKQWGASSLLFQAWCIISQPSMNSKLSHSPEIRNLGQNQWFFVLCDLEFDRWPWKTKGYLLYSTSSCVYHFVAIANSNWSYSPETPNLGQKRRFVSQVTLKFDRWPWKAIWHLSLATSSFLHHFVIICEFNLELQSGNG